MPTTPPSGSNRRIIIPMPHPRDCSVCREYAQGFRIVVESGERNYLGRSHTDICVQCITVLLEHLRARKRARDKPKP
jgi:hypothetical protein